MTEYMIYFKHLLLMIINHVLSFPLIALEVYYSSNQHMLNFFVNIAMMHRSILIILYHQ
jgi:hypothetical protein